MIVYFFGGPKDGQRLIFDGVSQIYPVWEQVHRPGPFEDFYSPAPAIRGHYDRVNNIALWRGWDKPRPNDAT